MKKKIPLIISLILLAVAIIVLVMFGFNKFGKGNSDSYQLVKYQTSFGGDMIGSFSQLSIEKLDDETAIIRSCKAEWYSQDPTVGEYIVPISVLEEVNEVFRDSNLKRCKKLPDSKVFALDAGSTSYSFNFEDKDTISFDTNKIVPKKAYDAIRQIDDIIAKAMLDEYKLPALVIVPVDEEESYNRLVDGACSIEVFEYYENYLHYRVLNGFDNEIELEDSIAIYKLDGDNKVEIYSQSSDYPTTVSEQYQYDSTILLENRLEAGKYQLVIADYQCEFEIK